eukprot:CAMPEP_0201121438 /NCGR_PEP_ID=MMETSP0850-20130426/5323_1 /ASSEMBLY_ACC=CAM_ASM_000622 /TAXON_ID=183588 /ORGANISM="Pseudo-nitzschia fraudulenta, Strain WWA7" /LENGTH=341 /DNA_ID=CAMNT_0047387893 /DNA_START=124 /DNA_END=1149 /DNA_ORIENTATION=-
MLAAKATTTTTSIVALGRRRIVRLSRLRRQPLSPPPAACFSSSPPRAANEEEPPPPPLVTTEFSEDRKTAVLRMHRAPANALSMEMCTALSESIRELDEKATSDNGGPTAVVLASSLPSKIFSAGLDIPTELYRPDPDRLPRFWSSFQQLFLDLYGSKNITTVAALEGHAPAAGCMLALSCDYRVMGHSVADPGKNGTIGLNESRLGIVAPPWMCKQYEDVLGHRGAELALLSGRLFRPPEALELGLVDELVDADADREDASGAGPVERAALARAGEFAAVPPGARRAVKERTREALLGSLGATREEDAGFFCGFVTSDPAQAAIGRYLEALAAAGKRKTK